MALNPNSPHARDVAHVLHPVTDLATHKDKGPLLIERGQGIFVYDETGKDYIEGVAGLWCTGLGFSEPELVRAAAEQMAQLPFYHAFAARSTNPIIDLAERLKGMMPFEAGKVLLLNSGSEANDTQIKLMWYYNNAIGRPERKKVISRQKAYHGSTIGAASLTGLAPFQRDFDLPLSNIIHTECPNYFWGAEPGESEEQYSGRLAESLDALIQREGPETVAAFIAEPVMGAGGVLLPPKGYFPAIQSVLRKYDILSIDDEVICGFARTGNMFGCETFDFAPDTMSLAKQLSSGYLPIAAVVIPDFMYEALVDESRKIGIFGHGMTYGGHPVPAAVALRTLELYEERDILGHVRKVAPRFAARMRKLADHPLVDNVRSVGLIGAVELLADKAKKRPFDPAHGVGKKCAAACEAEGLIARPLGDSIGLCPPMIITEAEIDEMFDRLARAIDQVADEVTKEKLAA
jgi:4-aminobutyrate--pyruvate transaminase